MPYLPIRQGNKLYPILLIVAILWAPALNIVGITDVRLSGQVAFEVVVILALATAIAVYVNLWCGLFLTLAFASSLYPVNTEGSISTFRYVLFGLAWYSVLSLSANPDYLMDAICVVCIGNIVWIIVQCFGLDPLTKATEGYSQAALRVGLLANQNEASALIAICSPAFGRGRWKYLLPFVVLGLVLTKTTGGLMSFTIGLLFYLYFQNKAYAGVGFLLSIYAFILHSTFIDRPTFKRLDAWDWGWKFFKIKWCLGWGLGRWKTLFGKLYEIRELEFWWNYAHNEFVQGFVEMGTGLGVLITGYFINIFRRFTKEALLPTTAVVIIVASSMVHFPVHIAQTSIIVLTWMAILEIKLRGDNYEFKRSSIFRSG